MTKKTPNFAGVNILCLQNHEKKVILGFPRYEKLTQLFWEGGGGSKNLRNNYRRGAVKNAVLASRCTNMQISGNKGSGTLNNFRGFPGF